ncbi:hypothetical protein [Methylobacterium gregans]|uniref:Uncharacterized protein n=1 Tax=Methylobacterium gregans TaxID=374424 RepID=A0AA37HTA7_9HYPH|nr:hypothetical protein [Methylobacterium gregans]MDQ0520390.1 hypothetical protein [Methylobacterium gregans]GJD81533.1 hypothetical protein NBEOAGPD_4786 [Methylobacterium gregans]GLS52352.1 hypothetical protein GCM10007886_05340 [Methylobacterium gregans]
MPRSFPCRPVLAGLVVLAAGPALAQGAPRSVGECERLKNDLAYNQCLAMFGPAARNVAGGFAAADTPSAATQAAIPQAEEPRAEAGRGRRYRGRHGRQRAVFTSGGRR